MTFVLIPGYPDYEINEEGIIRNINKQSELTTYSVGAYKRVWIDNALHYVHALVLLTFVGPRPDGMWIRHLDGDGSNNCLTNLSYGTQLENAQDRALHGTWGSKLNERKVKIIRGLHRCGFTCQRISEIFSLHNCTVSRITRNLTWKHI